MTRKRPAMREPPPRICGSTIRGRSPHCETRLGRHRERSHSSSTRGSGAMGKMEQWSTGVFGFAGGETRTLRPFYYSITPYSVPRAAEAQRVALSRTLQLVAPEALPPPVPGQLPGPPLDPPLLCRHFHYHKPFFLHPFVSSVSLW